MANAYRIQVGDNVSYLSPFVTKQSDIRWRVAKVVSVISQTSLVLGILDPDAPSAVNGKVSLNGGSPVPKWTRDNATNVWRPY
jgi:hypothetical protein